MLTDMQLLQTLPVVFAAILFLQTGLDKLFNFRENEQYIASVFAKTVLNKISTILFVLLAVMEITAAFWSVFGAVMLIWKGDSIWAWRAMVLGAVTLLCLFGGQRIAKDYAGASGIVPYLLVFIAGLFLLAVPAVNP